MSPIKFNKEIEELLANLDRIPDEFFVRTDGGKYRALWIMSRQKPSVEANYTFDEERFGITNDGRVIWGFDSGCSCPSPWGSDSYGDDYSTREWKDFEVNPETAFDAGWEDECYQNLKDYTLLLKTDLGPLEVLHAKNAEIRRFLIKRVSYDSIRNHVSSKVLHTDGTSELLQFGDGDKYVKVKDHSTEREYLLFVPEFVKSCRQGIAWTFGLNENEYAPEVET